MMTKNLFTKCFVMMALAVLFVGCPKPTDSPEVVDDNVTLTFLYNDAGSEDYELTMKVKKGVKKALPLISDEFFSSWQAPGGKMFGGWVVSKGDIVTDEERSADPTIFDVGLAESYTKNTTFVARWGTPVTVTFDKKNGTVDFGEQQMVTEFPMPLKDIYKTATEIGAPTGKEFAGWANQNGKQVIARNAQLFKPDADCTLDAIWMGMETVDKGTTWKLGTSLEWPNGNGKERNPIDVQFDNSYLLSDHEVTYYEWKSIMKQEITEYVDNVDMKDYEPMRFVSWYEAIIYCNRRSLEENLEPVYTITGCDWETVKLTNSGSVTFDSVTCDFTKNGYRLPTEAEWECAARGSARATVTNEYLTVITGTSYSKWELVGTDLAQYGWSGNKSEPAFVMSHDPQNGYYDMYGNVQEWCWDNYENSYSNNRTSNQGSFEGAGSYDATSIHQNKLYRGGGYNSGVNNQNANWQRITFRDTGENPMTRKAELGFRVCRTVTP